MCLNPHYLGSERIYVDCGKCVECRIKKSRQWAFRVMLEAREYPVNCMLTLTYNNENLPEDSSLNLRDLQLFFKRLRKYLGEHKIRYFACGEYGAKRERPHFHIILFNYEFPDMVEFCFDKKKTQLYRSKTLEKLWTKGYSTIGKVNYDSALYCASYLQKKPSGKKKPFVTMSRRPGIAFNSIDVKMLDSDKIYYNGKYISLPKYFLDTLAKTSPEKVQSLKDMRLISAQFNSDSSLDTMRIEENKRRRKKFERIFKKSLDENFMV